MNEMCSLRSEGYAITADTGMLVVTSLGQFGSSAQAPLLRLCLCLLTPHFAILIYV